MLRLVLGLISCWAKPYNTSAELPNEWNSIKYYMEWGLIKCQTNFFKVFKTLILIFFLETTSTISNQTYILKTLVLVVYYTIKSLKKSLKNEVIFENEICQTSHTRSGEGKVKKVSHFIWTVPKAWSHGWKIWPFVWCGFLRRFNQIIYWRSNFRTILRNAQIRLKLNPS